MARTDLVQARGPFVAHLAGQRILVRRGDLFAADDPLVEAMADHFGPPHIRDSAAPSRPSRPANPSAIAQAEERVARRRASRQKREALSNLDVLNLTQLRALAKHLDISGRSGMDADELRAAITKATAEPEDEEPTEAPEATGPEVVNADEYQREDLDALAKAEGVEDADQLANKDEVADAINAKRQAAWDAEHPASAAEPAATGGLTLNDLPGGTREWAS